MEKNHSIYSISQTVIYLWFPQTCSHLQKNMLQLMFTTLDLFCEARRQISHWFIVKHLCCFQKKMRPAKGTDHVPLHTRDMKIYASCKRYQQFCDASPNYKSPITANKNNLLQHPNIQNANIQAVSYTLTFSWYALFHVHHHSFSTLVQANYMPCTLYKYFITNCVIPQLLWIQKKQMVRR